jgi:hypothetical protein
MEAIKPLVVLVLFGTILYGAYSVVQKGPSPEAGPPAGDAPPFAATQAAPQVEMPPAPPPAFEPSPVVVAAPPASPAPAPAVAASVAPPGALPPAPPATAAAVGMPPPAADPSPTYLSPQSASPPAADGTARPDRYATLPMPGLEPAALPDPLPRVPAPDPRSGSASSAAFASAWGDAHEKLAAGRYAEALAGLSVWYDDPSLGLEESQRLEDLLGQLAGTVIYSQQDLLLPPHVVAPGETLPTIAAPLAVSPRLLAKINGIEDPLRLVPGEHVKVLRGPFDAVVSISRRRLSLQLGGSYAGSFPVLVGRQYLARVGGALPVADVSRGSADLAGTATLRRAIVLGDGLAIEAVDDPSVASDNVPPSSLVVSVRDLEELIDILGPGSRVLVRQ